MSVTSFEYLIDQAFGPNHQAADKILAKNLYENFIKAEAKHQENQTKNAGQDEVLSFAFERLRLGIGAILMHVCARLSENPESGKVTDLLLEALEAKTIEEIDRIMHDGVAVFENLYAEVFINRDREKVMQLFERILEAQNKTQLNAVLRDSLQTLDQIHLDDDQA